MNRKKYAIAVALLASATCFSQTPDQTYQNHQSNKPELDFRKRLDPMYLDSHLCKLLLKNAGEKINLYVEILKDRALCEQRNPMKLLLYGEPGCGKTDLALAMAQESGRKAIFVNSATVADQYKNSGAKNIEEIFAYAQSLNEPVVLILDEFQAITADYENPNNPDKNMVTSLWKAIDKCQNNSNIFIVATTNYKDKMPSQLQDRFSGKLIEIKNQNTIETKSEIIEFYLNKHQHSCDKNCIKEIAKKVKNLSARKIVTIVNNAALWATKRKGALILKEDFNEPINEMMKEVEDCKKREASKNGDGLTAMKVVENVGTILHVANEAIRIACPVCKFANAISPGSCPEFLATTLCAQPKPTSNKSDFPTPTPPGGCPTTNNFPMTPNEQTSTSPKSSMKDK